MPPRPEVYAAHLELIAAGGELVTANREQARELARVHAHAERAAGRPAFHTPRILPWRAWLEREFRELPERPALLDELVAAGAWQRIVADSRAGQELLSIRGIAGAAARSWALAHEWRVDLARLEPASAEQAAFAGWAREFAALGRRDGWLDSAALAALLAEARARQPARLIGFHGFDLRTPARARLAAALAADGCSVRELDLGQAAAPGGLSRHAAASPEAELDAIAAWLVARLARDPQARLAVVIPDLARRWRSVQRLLDDRLQPAVLGPDAAEERPYTLATGPRLADVDVVDAALLMLALGSESLDLALAGRILRSPYLGGAELERRARLDARLREAGGTQLAPDVLRALAASEAGGCPEFARTVGAVRHELAGPSRRSFAEWSAAMQRALRAGGWPRDRELTRSEYQAAHRFRELLTASSGLARVRTAAGFAAAHAELASLVAATPFEAELGDAPIRVLDRYEPPGIAFDGLWVAGLADDAFPATAAPDPFLPLALQRAHEMPHASAGATLAAARRALAAWLRCTPELVLSHARRVEEVEREPSRLLPAAPAYLPAEPLRPWALELLAGARLSAYEDHSLPPLPRGAPLQGGARLLELQSQCPFRAAATLRLGAQSLASPALGVAPRWRGERLHAALAAFWRAIGSHAALVALGTAGRVRAADDAVREAIGRRDASPLPPRLLELEAQWMQRALLALAEHELGREPFAVSALESPLDADFDGHALALRIDRLDRLEDGGSVVIDYKSGRRTPRRWLGPRPDQPQLPLYASQLPDPPAAVVLALLPLVATGFKGYAARTGILPGVGPPPASAMMAAPVAPGAVAAAPAAAPAAPAATLGPLVAGWRAVMRALVAQFVAGAAQVDPTPEACEYCALAVLCRIDARPEPAEDAAAPDEGPRAAAAAP